MHPVTDLVDLALAALALPFLPVAITLTPLFLSLGALGGFFLFTI